MKKLITITLSLAWFLSSAALIQAEKNHNNQVYFTFFFQSGWGILMGDDSEATPPPVTPVIRAQDVTKGENPDNNQPVVQTPTTTPPTTDTDQVVVSWDVGRSKSTDVANSFKTWVQRSSDPGEGRIPPTMTLGTDDKDNTYLPKEMNFWISFDLNKIPIQPDVTADPYFYVTIPGLTVYQSHHDTLKYVLNAVKDFGETIYEGSELAASITMLSNPCFSAAALPRWQNDISKHYSQRRYTRTVTAFHGATCWVSWPE